MKQKLVFRPGAQGDAILMGQPFRGLVSHHHEELELNLILSGTASYLFGRQRARLFPSHLIWLFPQQEHVLIDCSPDFSMWVLVFRPDLVTRHTKHASRSLLRMQDPGDILCRHIDTRRAESLHQIYHSALDDRQDLEFSNTALGYALIASWQAFRFARESVPRTDVHPAVRKAAHLISEADSPIPLNQLARKAGLSPARLSRLFKVQTGMNLAAFRQRKCLERFIGFYRTGARSSLTQAALQAGFGSYPQFHRVFSRLMGMSPAMYRKSLETPAGS